MLQNKQWKLISCIINWSEYKTVKNVWKGRTETFFKLKILNLSKEIFHALSKQIFGPVDLKVKRVELRALMLSPCVKDSQVKTSPTCLFLKPPVFTYIVLKKYFYSLNIERF